MRTSKGSPRSVRSAALALAAGLAVAAAPALADPAGAGEALDLEADEVEVDLEKKTARLEGRVSLRRGDVVVSCPRVDVRFGELPKVVWARGTGGVTAEARGLRATAPEAELDLVKGTLALRGEVRVEKDGASLRASGAVLELATGRLKLREVKGRVAAPLWKGP